jgi:hypothetical protein
MEARTAGATKGFNGHGYYYSTNDMADFLRSSGPNGNKSSPQADRNGYGGNVDPSSIDVERQGSKRTRAIWKRGVEAGA